MEVRVAYELGWESDGQKHAIRVSPDGVAVPATDALALGVTTVRGKETRRILVKPSEQVKMLFCKAELSFDLASADAILLNGYNSWTDTRERKPNEGMRGMRGVPRRVIDRWVLDGSGDYRFTEQDHRPGHQHGFCYGYVRYGEDVLLVGSLNEDNGFTTIYEDLGAGLLRLHKEVPLGVLLAGEERELMAFGLVEGSLDTAVERWLALAHITARPAAPLVGFSSWYRYYQDITAERLLDDLAAVHELLSSRDLGPCMPVFQIDDGYTKIGDWTNPNTERFPKGMGDFAARIAEAGLLPGLWMAPLVCETESNVYVEHPDWLLRDENGELVPAGSNWSGYWPLDTRNPEARAHIRESLRMATYDWGFRLLKLDFLFAACMVPHDGMNRGELMADALDLLRESVADGTAFDLCGVPLMSAFGRTEYCRIGCDVGLDWDDVPWMRMLHRERVSTKRSLANTRGRAHLDGRAFRNDPDVFFLRKDVKLTRKQRSDLLGADAALAGMFLTSDDVSEWDQSQRLAFDLALTTFVSKELRT